MSIVCRAFMIVVACRMCNSDRVEDNFHNPELAGRPLGFENGFVKQLGVTRRDFGIGMTSPEVTELTRQLDLAALREYRDAVGRRTREIVGAFTAPDWEGATTTEAVQSAADQGGFGARAEMLVKVF